MIYTRKRITDYWRMAMISNTIRLLLLTTLTAASLALLPRALADGEVPAGSALRKDLFALARPKIEREAGQPVRFQGSMKQQDDWVFFKGTLVDAKGAEIPVGPAESPDAAILWKQKNGKWTVLEAAAGFSDVIWLDWAKNHRAPAELFE